jgi:hypothetical protein
MGMHYVGFILCCCIPLQYILLLISYSALNIANFTIVHSAAAVYTTKRNLYAAAVYRALRGLFYLGVFRAVFSSIICIFKNHGVRTIVNKNSVSVH